MFFPPFGTDQGCDQESTDESFQDSIVKRVKSFVGGDFFCSLQTNKETADVKQFYELIE